MNHKEVMKLASEAHEAMMQEARGFDLWGIETPVRDVQEFCTRFAALVAEAERERLAQHCESPKRTEEGWWSLTAEEIRRGAPE